MARIALCETIRTTAYQSFLPCSVKTRDTVPETLQIGLRPGTDLSL
jgi:hypothetical protein